MFKIKCDYPGCTDGLVIHQKRTIGEGKPDPLDLQTKELCSKCGGSGTLSVKNLPVQNDSGKNEPRQSGT
jgi:hypothetical protein